jgi:hypothetical protein
MYSDETFAFLMDLCRWRAVTPRNPFRCPCTDDPDLSACLLRQALDMALSHMRRQRPRARSRRRRTRAAARGRSSDPGDGSSGPSSRNHHHQNSRRAP